MSLPRVSLSILDAHLARIALDHMLKHYDQHSDIVAQVAGCEELKSSYVHLRDRLASHVGAFQTSVYPQPLTPEQVAVGRRMLGIEP